MIKQLRNSNYNSKNIGSNPHDDLKTLKKLGELRDNGILTEKEFQTKKKKILDRI